MKVLAILPCLVVAFLFCRCSDTQEAATVQFSATLISNLNVSETSTDTDKDFSASATIDATSNPQIKDHADGIQSYQVDSVKFAVVNYSSTLKDEVYFNGDFGFGSASASNPSTTCSTTFLNITHVANTGDFEIFPCNSLTNDIAAIFGTGTSAKVFMDGTLSKTPLTFTVQVKTFVTVTVKAN